MAQTLGYYGGKLVQSFEGEPRLKARLCEGGEWELGWGSTYWHDGRGAVKEKDTCTYEEAVAMYWNAIRTEVTPLIDNYSREPNQNQFDALASLAYNAGGHGIVKESLAYRYFNEGRFEDAANKFESYISATSAGPSEDERENSYYDGVWEWRKNSKGQDVALWIHEGEPCDYRKKMRGLLRRRLSEACLFSGYDWTEAARNDRVHLKLERYWDKSRGRWADNVISRTYFKDILPIAQSYPLQQEPISETPESPQEVAFSLPEPVAETVEPEPVVIEAPKPVGTKEYVHTPTDHVFDETLKPKAMELSETFRKAVIEVVSTGITKRADQAAKATTSGGLLASLILPLFQQKAFLVALVAVAIAFFLWVVSKIAAKVSEKAAVEKEAAREKGVQLKF